MPTLLQTALLGSERIGGVPTPPHASLLPAWNRIDWSGERERALLEALAVSGVVRLAGVTPSLVGSPPCVCEPEVQPIAPSAACALLPRLFDEEWKSVLPEWLECCASGGWLAPAFYLPDLLNRAKTAEERLRAERVSGRRGRWLAQQNPDWSWLATPAPDADEAVWETGTTEDRLRFFQTLRARDPARARMLLEKSWTEETPDTRSAAVARMVLGLSHADEPFLTGALADRRREVRAAVQQTLATLADSAFSQRQRERAAGLLSLKRGLVSSSLEVALPAAFDKEWKADGIEEKPPAGVGERAYWFQQILALVPLAFWTRAFGLTLPRLLSLAEASADWSVLLLGGWFRAAILHRDPAACAALADPVLKCIPCLPAGVSPASALATLLEHCSERDRWTLVTQHPSWVWSVLPSLSGQPTMEQARPLLLLIAPALRDGANPGGTPGAVAVAGKLPPLLREEAAGLLARESGFSKPAEAFLQTLALRSALHRAFSCSS